MEEKKPTLWTKNFTIITLGTVVSMCGATVSSFTSSILVFDQTGSTFLFALFMVANYAPGIIVTLFAGPFLDRFSRRKAIYTLDFISAGLMGVVTLLVWLDAYSYYTFLAVGIIMGIINAVYMVAYDSFYPNLITKGFNTKAYAVSSILYPLCSSIMMPVAAWAYKEVGLEALFMFTAASFFIAAVFEIFIKIDEQHLKNKVIKKYTLKEYFSDFGEGVSYVRGEKGLKAIIAYFTVTLFCDAALTALMLPFFQMSEVLTTNNYTLVVAAGSIGRLIGALVQYNVKFKNSAKFNVAVVVYISVSLLMGAFLFAPFYLMLALWFVNGMLGVTSYNIRISATQNYLPDEKRGRFNSVFSMMTNIGTMAGELVFGALGEFYFIPYIILASALLNVAAVFLIMLRAKNDVKLIYNREQV